MDGNVNDVMELRLELRDSLSILEPSFSINDEIWPLRSNSFLNLDGSENQKMRLPYQSKTFDIEKSKH